LDEYQLMKANAWGEVGAPMLLDNNGDAMFIFTQKRGPHHSKQLLAKALEDETGRWEAFIFSSHENPHISTEALEEITDDMTQLAYRMEILAEDIDDEPDALWDREMLEDLRVNNFPELARIVVGVDPPGGKTECGIVVAGLGMNGHAYVLEDRSLLGSPAKWGGAVVTAYNRNDADRVVGESNYGGDMVESTIRSVAPDEFVAYSAVSATRGKQVRAEPVAALYEKGRVHHVGEFNDLEDEMCTWVQGESKWSPNRMDALVWTIHELMLKKKKKKATARARA
jgi:phage terminase large subunit-like protein